MKFQRLSSNKELIVKTHTRDSPSSTLASRIAMRVRALFEASARSMQPKILNMFWYSSWKKDLIVQQNIEYNPLEELIHSISRGVDTLSDESIITLARGLHSMFWKWVQRERKTKIYYINAVIMPLVWKDEKLSTVLISDSDTIIERFGVLIKKRAIGIMNEKVARLR